MHPRNNRVWGLSLVLFLAADVVSWGQMGEIIGFPGGASVVWTNHDLTSTCFLQRTFSVQEGWSFMGQEHLPVTGSVMSLVVPLSSVPTTMTYRVGWHTNPTNLQRDLVLYYPMHGTTFDASTNTIDPQLPVSVLAATDHLGTAFFAYGFGGHSVLRLTNDAPLTLTSNLSWSAWIRPDNSLTGYVMSKLSSDSGYEMYLDGQNVCIALDDQSKVLSYDVSALAGQWFLVTFTWTGNLLRLYINEAEMASTTRNDPIDASTHLFCIGRAAAETNFFRGDIDELRVYSRSLSSNEVRQLLEFSYP